MVRAPAGISELVGSAPIVEIIGLVRNDAALGVKLLGSLRRSTRADR